MPLVKKCSHCKVQSYNRNSSSPWPIWPKLPVFTVLQLQLCVQEGWLWGIRWGTLFLCILYRCQGLTRGRFTDALHPSLILWVLWCCLSSFPLCEMTVTEKCFFYSCPALGCPDVPLARSREWLGGLALLLFRVQRGRECWSWGLWERCSKPQKCLAEMYKLLIAKYKQAALPCNESVLMIM